MHLYQIYLCIAFIAFHTQSNVEISTIITAYHICDMCIVVYSTKATVSSVIDSGDKN